MSQVLNKVSLLCFVSSLTPPNPVQAIGNIPFINYWSLFSSLVVFLFLTTQSLAFKCPHQDSATSQRNTYLCRFGSYFSVCLPLDKCTAALIHLNPNLYLFSLARPQCSAWVPLPICALVKPYYQKVSCRAYFIYSLLWGLIVLCCLCPVLENRIYFSFILLSFLFVYERGLV